MTPDKLNPKQEKTPYFFESIKLGEVLTVGHAIQQLGAFHRNSTTKAILDAFPHLRNANNNHKDATVIFYESVNSSAPCIRMEIKDKEGKSILGCYIDKFSGQPMQSVG